MSRQIYSAELFAQREDKKLIFFMFFFSIFKINHEWCLTRFSPRLFFPKFEVWGNFVQDLFEKHLEKHVIFW